MMQNKKFTLYAWRISWYSAKVRSYLQHRGIPFEEKKPSLFTFKHTIARQCGGDGAVPVLVTPEGEWLQDSTVIIEQLDKRFPTTPVLPTTPVQRFFSLLVEIWADEFWHPTAEHYRFSFPENYPIWRDELATLLPGFPKFLQHKLAKHFYGFMLDVTEKTGVQPEKIELIEQWTETQLDALEQHFAVMPYVLGQRASLADHSLMGPINGHLAWDPRSVKVLIEPRPHLHAWIQRMSSKAEVEGELLADDQLPDTLQPVLHSLFKDLIPYLEQCANTVNAMTTKSASDPRFERLGPYVDIPFGEGSLHRVVMPYTLWMVQRLQDQFAGLQKTEAKQVSDWLQENGGESLLTLKFSRLRRVGLHVATE